MMNLTLDQIGFLVCYVKSVSKKNQRDFGHKSNCDVTVSRNMVSENMINVEVPKWKGNH
jgi:hypothetical protein